MPASTVKSAKAGTALLGAVNVPISDWEFDDKTDLPEATDSSIGVNEKRRVSGRREGTFTLKGPLDHTTPQNVTMKSGVTLTNVNLTTDGVKKFVIATAFVESCKTVAPVAAGEPSTWDATCITSEGWTDFA